MRNSPEVRTPSARAQTITRRTYSRPLEGGGFETWDDIVGRVISHQRWLWQRALGDKPLDAKQENELEELREVLLARSGSVSGRTLWLGGTEVSKHREASQYNCAFTKIESVHDVVDAFWLLLQGCGVGFEPVVGTLNGFTKPMEIEVVRSQRHLLEQKKGRETNAESYTSEDGKVVWTISVGDSAEAWAKSVGKMLAGKRTADVLRLDFSQIRPSGQRLKGYGWISSGDETFAPAMQKIAEVLNARAGSLLSRIDILDVLNHLGTTLSSRRSAEIALVPYGDPEWEAFATAKKDFWVHNNFHRQQSNNSLTFHNKPSRDDITTLFALMQASGGSEPGFINFEEGKRRAPWMSGVNPCVPGDTLILTSTGYVPISERVGKKTEVWNGEQYSTVTPFSTGINPLVEVVLSDGTSLKCTPYHKWVLAGGVRVMAEELQAGDRLEKFAMPIVVDGKTYQGDAYSQGFYSGDGNAGYNFSYVYAPKYEAIPRLQGVVGPEEFSWERRKWQHGPMLHKNFVPVDGTYDYCLNWLAGVLDADGTVTRDANGNGLQLTSVDKEFLLNVRLMLTRLGVRAKVVKGHEAGVRLLPNGLGGLNEYARQTSYRLLIGNTDTWSLIESGIRFERLKVHNNPPQRDARRYVTVREVRELNEWEETFCFTEPLANRGTFNGIVTGQCAEILLPNKGFCVAGDTPLIVENGLTTLKEACGKTVKIFNGQRWVEVVPFQTGTDDKLYRVEFGDGSYLDVTANHRFFVADRFGKEYKEMRTHELKEYQGYRLHTEPFAMTKSGGKQVAEAYTVGFYVGDGNGNRIDIYHSEKLQLPLAGSSGVVVSPAIGRRVNLPFDWKWATTLKTSLKEVFGWDYDSILNFVSGLADADGSEAGRGIRIYQANEQFCRELQLLLTSVGIRSSVNLMAEAGQVTNLGRRLQAVWYVQITDTSKLRCQRLAVGNDKRGNKNKNQTIVSIKELPGRHPSYCFTEPETTKGVFNNSLTGQCNLVEINLSHFNGKNALKLWRTAELLARANYRQTCVNLVDGILQRAWHENNEFLRLCGVGVTGVAEWEPAGDPAVWRMLRDKVKRSAWRMADELGLPRPKAVTTVKPSGTLSKIMDTTEGVHKPLGRYIFNNVRFSKHDPYVQELIDANYRVFQDPSSPDAVLVTFPVAYPNVKMDEVDGKFVNLEPAIVQLARYKSMMDNYVDHNCSVTISYSPEEESEIVEWLHNNWDSYVGVSFLYRTDPTKTAQDLGYLYLPQEVVTKEEYEAYAVTLKPLSGEETGAQAAQNADEEYEIDAGGECAGGACPVR